MPFFPPDYEVCDACQHNHEYELGAAQKWHDEHDVEEFLNTSSHLRILATGCGYRTTEEDDPGYHGLEPGEFIMWHPKTGHAYVVRLERLVQEDVK